MSETSIPIRRPENAGRSRKDTTHDMPHQLVELVRTYEGMSSRERESDEAKLLLAKVHAAGYTADFFGGFDGMRRLHDAAEELVGNDNSVGYWLNYMWNGIGRWLA